MSANIRLTQSKPFGAAGSPTQALVQFQEFGPVGVEFYEVYATTDIGAFDATLVETVDASPKDPELSATIDLVAGMIYEIRICPRTTTKGERDAVMEGQPWENWCQTARFATQADAPSFPKPQIFSVLPRPTTIRRKNHVQIQWNSPKEYTFYQVRFSEARSGSVEQQIDRIAGGAGGTFTLEPTIPGVKYSFKVNGLMRHFSETGSSGFTDPVFAIAAANTRSLREFAGPDAAGGIRRFMVPATRSLRQFMGV